MRENNVTFDTYEGNVEDIIEYEELTGHLIFDMKLRETYRIKVRFLANGNLVETSSCTKYSTVVSRDSI